MTTRTVTVTGWLASYQVRRHLEVFSIPYSEERGLRDSVFTVEADEEQWVEINRYVQEVTA